MIRFLALVVAVTVAFQPPTTHTTQMRRQLVRTVKLDPELEATTKKWGVEGGLFQIFKSDADDKGNQAKELLKEYGIAYLATSITLAIISFGICYVLVDSGIDVGALLSKINIDLNDTTEKAGTIAIAYAAHKAASPIRFPPTVALTPIVAKFLKKKSSDPSAEE